MLPELVELSKTAYTCVLYGYDVSFCSGALSGIHLNAGPRSRKNPTQVDFQLTTGCPYPFGLGKWNYSSPMDGVG